MILTALLLILCATVSAATQAEYYVATDGSDSNPGTLSEPFATLERARDQVRTINASQSGDIIVYVKSGRYFVDSTVEFNESDSGTNGYSVIYKNYDQPGSASFVGGQIITNWQLYQGDIYYADLGVPAFHTLYENGKRVRKARTPNYVHDEQHPVAEGDYFRATGFTDNRTQLQYSADDLDPSSWDLDDAQVYMWSGGKWNWFTDTTPIASIDTGTRIITLQEEVRYPIHNLGLGSRYYVQGILDLLDQPGEFHYDSSAGRLYYWATDGDIHQQEIMIPKVERIISLIGSDESHCVSNVKFEGLCFEISDFTGWYRHACPFDGGSGEGHQYPEYDRQISMPQHRTGMIYMENTDGLTITNCVIRNAGYSGIYCNEFNQNNRFEGNWVSHTGRSGIFFEGRYAGEGDVLKNNVVTNCLVHDVGELAGQAAGVCLTNSSSNEVSYCDIYDSKRYAVLIVAYRDIPRADIYAYGNQVKYLNIHDCCQDSGDTAPIYIWGASDDAPYHQNYYEQLRIHDIYAHASMLDYGPHGIYMDNDSYGQSFTNIKVSNVQGAYLALNDSGSHTYNNVSWRSGFNESLMDYDNIGVRTDFLYPVSPGGLDAGYDETGVTLSWFPVHNAASYCVYRAEAVDGPYQKLTDTVTTASFLDTSAVPGQIYYYKISSLAGGGAESDLSISEKIFFQPGHFSDDFEDGFEKWTAAKGQPSATDEVAYSGQHSYQTDEDMDVIYIDFLEGRNDSVSIWFYDDADDTSVQAMARVDGGSWNDSGSWAGLGVNTGVSSTYYVKRIGSATTATDVPRSTGWHQLRWEYAPGQDGQLYIDSQSVGSTSLHASYSMIALGDWWGDSNQSNIYFDAVQEGAILKTDFNHDGTVNMFDLQRLAVDWLQHGFTQ